MDELVPGQIVNGCTILEKPYLHIFPGGHPKWKIQVACACGNSKIASVADLLAGRSLKCAQCRHVTHGLSKSRLYSIWQHMKRRCDCDAEPFYEDYGGRGISYAPAWTDFPPFRKWAETNGYAPNLQLDRIDPNGNYTPENCRWVTAKVNSRNKRPHHHRLLTGFGETKTMADWVDDPRCIVGLQTLRGRLNGGWCLEKAVTTPPRPTSRVY